MRIAMLASEAAPLVKTGGLGDVMQALPVELSKVKGNEVVLFLPYYKKLKENAALKVELVGSFNMDLAWRESYVGIYRLKSRRRKLQIYFIDNDYYFGARSTVYGDFDDGERFTYYSKAALAALYYMDFKPDILHCHDWQAAMGTVYWRVLYQNWSPATKTVFTIHNVEYQGWADASFFETTLGLPEFFRGHMTFDGSINLMKGAIELADITTTVSKTYAQELKLPYYAHRLDGILRNARLEGIINGIDTDVYDPSKDTAIAANFSAKDMQGKWENKRALREELGLRTDADMPIMGMVTRLARHKGIDLLCYIAQSLMERDVQLVIVGTGEKQYELLLSALAKQYPGKVAVCLAFDPKLASRVYAGVDMYLMPSKSEPCGLSQLIAMRYGAVPIVSATGGLKDTVLPYDRETKEGRGFAFRTYNAEEFLSSIDAALALYYENRDAFNALAKRNMQIDFSWQVPAGEYMQLYTKLLT